MKNATWQEAHSAMTTGKRATRGNRTLLLDPQRGDFRLVGPDGRTSLTRITDEDRSATWEIEP